MVTTSVRARTACGLRILAAAAAVMAWVAGTAATATARSGRELYEAACAACHGSDGRGGAAAASSLPLQPPDLTDCSFASREPDNDWIAVAHGGGPARGFDRQMPSFAELLTVDELRRIVTHVRTFCVEDGWPRGELNLPRAQVTSKAFPEDEAALRVIADQGAVTTRFVYARRLGARAQVEVVVPVSLVEDATGDWRGGVGDLAFAYKRVLAHSLPRGAIVSVAGELVVPTGSTERGIGGGATVVEAFVAYGQLLTARTFLQLQLGGAVPIDRDHPDELFARAVAGRRLLADGGHGRAWSPMVELLGARAVADDARLDVDVVPQLQVTLSARQHVVASVGVRVPVTDRVERPTQVMTYLIWDWYDGGFLTGW
ncbi:MAG: cytochrome c [Kofleriaceae bacterium]|nr:cytochrome c [Kofleriaceae bacterium]MCL4223647.1 c-type cytochrome [Myxococcales bacterium]